MANPTTLIQGDPSSKVDLLPSGTVTANGNGNSLVGTAFYTAFIALLDVTAASGTSPTLDVYIQTQLPDESTWTDIAAFAQSTGTGKRVMGFVAGGNTEFAQGSGTLAAATFRTIPLGSRIRVLYKVGGTSPSFTFSVSAEFYI